LLNGVNGIYTVRGAQGKEMQVGGSDCDALNGGEGQDLLLGGTGNDQLYRGTGTDTLEGGAGNDVLIGGTGTDVFIFEGATGTDSISDFQSDEVIILATEIGGETLSYTEADVLANITYTGAGAVIDLTAIYELSASDAAVPNNLEITLTGVSNGDLDASNFVVPGDGLLF